MTAFDLSQHYFPGTFKNSMYRTMQLPLSSFNEDMVVLFAEVHQFLYQKFVSLEYTLSFKDMTEPNQAVDVNAVNLFYVVEELEQLIICSDTKIIANMY